MIDVVCGFYFGVYGSVFWIYDPKDKILTFPGYELSFGPSLAKVSSLGAENKRSTHTETDRHCAHLYIDRFQNKVSFICEVKSFTLNLLNYLNQLI